MNAIAQLLIVVLLFQLSGCAAMFHGTSDQITVQSAEPDTKIYLDTMWIGRNTAVTAVKRNTTHTLIAKKPGCQDGIVMTTTSFDAVSLLGLLIDFGLISMLVVDWAATGAMWKIDPVMYNVNPMCDGLEPAPLRNGRGPKR